MCVTEPPCPLFHPEKSEILPFSSSSSSLYHPHSTPHPAPLSSASTQLWSAPAAMLQRWQSREGESKEGVREERKRWQLLNKCEALGKRRRKEKRAILMMSLSPWEEEETYAASRGAGAGLKHALTHILSFYTHTHIYWVNHLFTLNLDCRQSLLPSALVDTDADL